MNTSANLLLGNVLMSTSNCIELLDDIVDMMNMENGGRTRPSSANTFSSEDLEVIARKLEFGKIVLWLCQLMFLESKSQLLGNMLADWANFYNGYLHGIIPI